ncbi:MAG: Dabb family protein [Isosphaeraceae bacterium]|nr:Dabb family protein [Isosphaeraceae bacterium]
MLVHNVFFTLHDGSPEAIARLIESCREHLAGHPGEVFFAVGGLEPELDRPVNDRDFHVALTVVFEDRAAHDAYQVEPRHLRFIETNKPTWAKVRVFDSID